MSHEGNDKLIDEKRDSIQINLVKDKNNYSIFSKCVKCHKDLIQGDYVYGHCHDCAKMLLTRYEELHNETHELVEENHIHSTIELENHISIDFVGTSTQDNEKDADALCEHLTNEINSFMKGKFSFMGNISYSLVDEQTECC